MFKKIAVAATIAILSSTAFANGAPGIYAGADFGTTKLDDKSGRENSFGAFVGYRITPAIAIEAGYRRLADFDYTVDRVTADVQLDQVALSAIGTLPLSGGFSLFGRLGYNNIKAKASAGAGSFSDSESGVLYGIGASYAFSPTVAGRIEVQKPTSDSTNVSAGVVFNF